MKKSLVQSTKLSVTLTSFLIVILLILFLTLVYTEKVVVEEEEYLDQSIHNLQDFGIDEYMCSGTCWCSEDQRRAASTTSTRLSYFVSALTTVAAFEFAKNHFKHSCLEELEDKCPSYLIESEVETCESTKKDNTDEEETRTPPAVLEVTWGKFHLYKVEHKWDQIVYGSPPLAVPWEERYQAGFFKGHTFSLDMLKTVLEIYNGGYKFNVLILATGYYGRIGVKPAVLEEVQKVLPGVQIIVERTKNAVALYNAYFAKGMAGEILFMGHSTC